MDERQAWQDFQRTGSVYAYLEYCQWKHSHIPGEAWGKVEENTHADSYRWIGNPGEQRGGE